MGVKNLGSSLADKLKAAGIVTDEAAEKALQDKLDEQMTRFAGL